MINDLFERVGGLLEKDFLFSAWIPVLLAALWFVGIWIVVVGTEACFAWYDGLTASQQFALAFLSALATVVLAYLMTALRTTFLRLWSGQTTLGILRPLFGALEFLEERRYAKLRAPRPELWHGITAHMRARIGPVWSAERPAVPSEQKRRLERQLERLRSAASKSWVRSVAFRADVDAVIEDLRGECARYSGESLTDVYSGL